MKSLKELLYESILDVDLDVTDDIIKDQIKEWIEKNSLSAGVKISNNPDKNGKYVVDAEEVILRVNSNSLTNDLFVWGKITKYFNCGHAKITTLEGSPKYVGGFFDCSHCNNLVSLEGAPEEVNGSFNCNCNNNLISLEGAPQKVGRDFFCGHCQKLTSLKGAPKIIKRNFYCNNCPNLNDSELDKIKAKKIIK